MDTGGYLISGIYPGYRIQMDTGGYRGISNLRDISRYRIQGDI